MSTKIYNGFEFRTHDLFEVHRHIMEFRKTLKPLVAEKVARVHAERIVYIMDRVACGWYKAKKENKGRALISVSSSEIREKQRNIKAGGRNPSVDFIFNIAILPLRKNRVLGIVYTEQDDFLKLWFRKKFVKDYGYWNNTDQPKGVSNKEWHQRERDWDEVLPDSNGVPSMNGFGADCVHELFDAGAHPQISEILKHIPPFKRRVRHVAIDGGYKTYLKLKRISYKSIVKNGTIFSHFMNYRDWLRKDPQGKKFMAKQMARFSKILKRRITKKDCLKEVG
jgi:hypothetical protein